MPRFINPVPQYLNSAGDPIVLGEMYFYEIGSVTPKDTYLDAELTIPATNPVLLNADGRLPNTYLLGSYRTVLSEPSTGQIWERDNVGSEFSEGYGSEWNSTVTYNIPDVVLFSGSYYQSLTNSNIDNLPSSSPGNWASADFIPDDTGDNLKGSDLAQLTNTPNFTNGIQIGGVRLYNPSGQLWINETSSRAAGVSYSNSTDNAIMVSIVMSGTAAAQGANVAVDSMVIDKFSLNSGTGGARSSLQVVVPIGSTYILQNVTGVTLESWRELKK